MHSEWQSILTWREALKTEMNETKLEEMIPTPTGNDNCWCYNGESGYEARAKNSTYTEKFGDDRWKVEIEKPFQKRKVMLKI